MTSGYAFSLNGSLEQSDYPTREFCFTYTTLISHVLFKAKCAKKVIFVSKNPVLKAECQEQRINTTFNNQLRDLSEISRGGEGGLEF